MLKIRCNLKWTVSYCDYRKLYHNQSISYYTQNKRSPCHFRLCWLVNVRWKHTYRKYYHCYDPEKCLHVQNLIKYNTRPLVREIFYLDVNDRNGSMRAKFITFIVVLYVRACMYELCKLLSFTVLANSGHLNVQYHLINAAWFTRNLLASVTTF